MNLCQTEALAEELMQENVMKKPDISFLKDMSDIVRARILFFIPFFLAFLTFLLNKKDYLIGASPFIKIIAVVTIILSLVYTNQVIQTLSLIEATRLFFGIKHANEDFDAQLSSDDRDASAKMISVAPKAFALEARLFRWIMYLFYFDLTIVLIDLYFGGWLDRLLHGIFLGKVSETKCLF